MAFRISSFAQYVRIAALEDSQKIVNEMVSMYKTRRDIITEGLNSLPGVVCDSPEGLFILFQIYRELECLQWSFLIYN